MLHADTGNVESNTTSTSAEPCTGTEGQENSQTGDSASQSRGEAAAARRVAEVLPAVLALMEECLSVLADDAADVDNNADSDGSSVAILSDRSVFQLATHSSMNMLSCSSGLYFTDPLSK